MVPSIIGVTVVIVAGTLKAVGVPGAGILFGERKNQTTGDLHLHNILANVGLLDLSAGERNAGRGGACAPAGRSARVCA